MAAFNQEKDLVGAFSVIVKLQEGSFAALVSCRLPALAREVVRGGGHGGHVQVLVPVRPRDTEQSVQGGGSEGDKRIMSVVLYLNYTI